MPLNPINYSNTIMYKIVCNDLNITDSYVGHTTNFKSRKIEHKYSCNKEDNKSYNCKVYQFIRANGGWDNWSMIMIEEYNGNNKLEILKREREIIEELKSTLNFEIPSRTKKEYREDNKDKILDRLKIYYKENKDKILEKQKKYSEENKDKIKEKINCECGGCFRKNGKSRHIKTKLHQDYITSVDVAQNNYIKKK